jgi:hypothetical protein
MANAETLLSGVTSDTTSPSLEVVCGRAISFQAKSVGSSGSSALSAQVSLDGSIWSGAGAVPINGAVLVHPAYVPVKFVRVVYEANGSSNPVTCVTLQSDEDD